MYNKVYFSYHLRFTPRMTLAHIVVSFLFFFSEYDVFYECVIQHLEDTSSHQQINSRILNVVAITCSVYTKHGVAAAINAFAVIGNQQYTVKLLTSATEPIRYPTVAPVLMTISRV